MGLQGQIKDAPGEGNYDEITMKLIGVDGGELWSEKCQEALIWTA